jgi:hypothetical protein
MHSASFSREHWLLTEVDDEVLPPPQADNAAQATINSKAYFFILAQ